MQRYFFVAMVLVGCGRSDLPESELVLGCDDAGCYGVSNVIVARGGFDTSLGSLSLDAVTSIDTDTGAVLGSTVERAAGEGVDAVTETVFAVQPQSGAPDLAVLSVRDLVIGSGVQVDVIGARPLVILASGTVTIDGVIDAGARGAVAGPGGADGGAADQNGHGPCGGQVGEGSLTECIEECVSGGGGGGHGAPGGNGGDVYQPGPVLFYAGGPAGYTCGAPSLVPLVGGSGGSGGVSAPGFTDSNPGSGGGGGGAIQITAREAIVIGASGGITVPGGGGGESFSCAGAGGGAGGAILLEAPRVAVDGFLAANGGGGGGGDCT